jgi:hypothetical protein
MEQLTSRDAALLTWIGVGLLAIAWSMLRGGEVGRGILSAVGSFFAPRVAGMVAVVAAWLVLVVYLATHIGLWDTSLLKDTIVIIAVGAFMTGFKALAVMDGKETMRHEVRSVVALVVVIQFVANLRTFPYVVELILVPVAVLLGGMQALANHREEHKTVRPVINGMIILLGACIFVWSVYKVAGSLGSTEWETVGKSFAMAFWLPAALLPAIYVAALVMQYGKTISMMKIVRPPSLGARLDFYRHHGLSLRRLSAFSRSRGRAREYARADSRDERLAILRAPASD